jgi:hypothetical protein
VAGVTEPLSKRSFLMLLFWMRDLSARRWNAPSRGKWSSGRGSADLSSCFWRDLARFVRQLIKSWQLRKSAASLALASKNSLVLSFRLIC